MFQIYAAFWVTGNFKTGINLENFPVELDDIQKFSLFWYFKKKEEESLIEHFLSLQIDDEKARAQMNVQEQVLIQIPAKKTSKALKKQLKITSFFK